MRSRGSAAVILVQISLLPWRFIRDYSPNSFDHTQRALTIWPKIPVWISRNFHGWMVQETTSEERLERWWDWDTGNLAPRNFSHKFSQWDTRSYFWALPLQKLRNLPLLTVCSCCIHLKNRPTTTRQDHCGLFDLLSMLMALGVHSVQCMNM